MLNRFRALSFKNKIITILTVGLILFLIPVMTITFLLRKTDKSSEQTPAIQFEYCGVSPKELCILSFSRDGAGNTLINFHVPNRKFPDFYLMIKKAGMESRYECIRNSEIKTSVICHGEPLSLRQTVEINIFAIDDGHLLASGTFFIEAFLVSTQDLLSTPQADIGTVSPETTSSVVAPTLGGFATKTPTPIAYPYP